MAITRASGTGAPGTLPGDPGSEYNRIDGPPYTYRKLGNGWVAADLTDDAGVLNYDVIPMGSTAQTCCVGNDSRLSNARTPTAHASTHVTGGSDIIANVVAAGNAGLMTGADKTKLDGVATGATANSTDATLLNRANHTGSQAESTITNLVTDLAAKEATANKNAASGYAGLDGSSKLTGSQQVYGSAANTACQGNDSRLSDSRAPNGNAGGNLTGTYPNPSIGSAQVTNAMLAGSIDLTAKVTGQLPFANGGDAGTAATSATTGTMTVNMTTAVITITPTGACTFNGSGGLVGQLATFVITTSGVSSFTLTWGTNFRSTGTLATGTTTAKIFTVTFRCIAATPTWVEVSRTIAQ